MINKIFTNASYYTLARFLPMGLGFITLPIFSRYLKPEDYGYIGLVVVFQSFLPLIMSLKIDTSLYRFYVEFDEEKRKVFLSTLISVLFTISSFCALILFFFLENIIVFIFPNIDEQYYALFYLGMLTAYFNLFNGFLTNLLRVRELAKLLMSLQLSIMILGLIISVIEVIYLGRGAYGFLESILITSIISFLIFLIFNLNQFVLKYDLSILKEPIIYSLPLIPHAFFTLIYLYSDRIILEKYITVSLIGLFFFSTRISDLFKMLVTEFQNSFLPHYFKTSKKNTELANTELLELSSIFISLLSFLVVLTSLFSFEIVYILFPSNYLEIWRLIPLLAFSYLFFSLFKFSNIVLFFNKKTTYIAFITFVSSILGILLNVLLIPIFGIFGAIYTQIILYFFLFFITFFIVKKLYRVDLEIRYISIILFFTFLILILSINLNQIFFELNFFLIYFLKFILLSGFILLVLKLKFDYLQKYSSVFKKIFLNFNTISKK